MPAGAVKISKTGISGSGIAKELYDALLEVEQADYPFADEEAAPPDWDAGLDIWRDVATSANYKRKQALARTANAVAKVLHPRLNPSVFRVLEVYEHCEIDLDTQIVACMGRSEPLYVRLPPEAPVGHRVEVFDVSGDSPENAVRIIVPDGENLNRNIAGIGTLRERFGKLTCVKISAEHWVVS